MANKSDDGLVFYILLILLYPFIWLYDKVGGKLFIVIILGVPCVIHCLHYLYKNRKITPVKPLGEKEAQELIRKSNETVLLLQKKHNDEYKSETNNTNIQHIASARQPLKTINDPWYSHCLEIEDAWERGDYDWARQQLQKIAYGMVNKGVSDEQRSAFKKLMSDFAKEDPLYKAIISKVKQLVKAEPGIIQSTVYSHFPQYDQETIRYVLYFANELGDIHRVKKGRSYVLHQSGETIN